MFLAFLSRSPRWRTQETHFRNSCSAERIFAQFSNAHCCPNEYLTVLAAIECSQPEFKHTSRQSTRSSNVPVMQILISLRQTRMRCESVREMGGEALRWKIEMLSTRVYWLLSETWMRGKGSAFVLSECF